MSVKVFSGIDLAEPRRLREVRSALRERFYRRVFTAAELEEIGTSFEDAAGHFAAKEAASKALGTGIGYVAWQELEILHQPWGAPQLFLHGRARRVAEKLGWTDWSVSITHSSGLAAAVVTAVADTNALSDQNSNQK